MKICVFGLGYVGIVTAACLADEGHEVVGVDVAKSKLDLIKSGKSPIIENKIGELVKKTVASGRFRVTECATEAVESSEMGIVCVGTPSRNNGSLDQSFVAQVVAEIGECLRDRIDHFSVVMRSTMVPGTMKSLVVPELERASGRPAGDGYDVLFHPEFLREGTSVYDFYHPPKIVVGEYRAGAARPLLDLYGEKFEGPRIVCDVQVAEMVKYCDNLYHAVKVTFANEVGQCCHALGVDSHEVMEIFCQDRKLNISPRYLKPGFAFGGSCLPKDMRAFLAVAKERDINLPMLQNVIPSNFSQIERTLRIILETEAKSIGFHGVAFKEGTDDLRESPYIELAERLMGKGKSLVFYDEMVQISRLVGRNRSYVESRFPHLADLVTDNVEELLDCQLILVCHKPKPEVVKTWKEKGKRVLDLTGFGLRGADLEYESIV